MREFSEHGNAFRDAFEAWSELEDLRLQQPELASVVEEGQRNAVERRQALESSASPDFEAAMLPAIDPAVETLRNEIENLRNTKAYHSKFISEATIQARLDALPQTESFSEDDEKFAKAYWVAHLLIASFNFVPVGNHASTAGSVRSEMNEEAVQGSPANQESLKLKLQATFYQDDSVLVIDGTAIPLNHGLDGAARNSEAQLLIQSHRLAIYTALSASSDTTYSARGLWEMAGLPQNLFDSWYFNQFIAGFIQNDLRVRNQPLFTVFKPSPNARRKYYKNDKYLIELGFSPNASPQLPEATDESESLEHFSQLPLHDAASLAEHINLRAPLLRQLGLQQLDDYIIRLFDENVSRDIIESANKQNPDIQRVRTDAFIRECLSPDSINSLLDELGSEDPRSDLLIYIYSMVQSEESRLLFEKAMRAQIVSVVHQDSFRRGVTSHRLDAVRYEFDDGSPMVEIPYNFIGDGPSTLAFNETPKSSAKPDQQPVLRRRDQKRVVTPAAKQTVKKSPEIHPRPEPAWETELKQKIGAVIDQLELDGLMLEGFVSPSTVQLKSSRSVLGTRESILRMQQAGILSKYRGDYRLVVLSPTDIVTMALFNTTPRELGKGMPHQKRAIELIRTSVESYFEHRNQPE